MKLPRGLTQLEAAAMARVSPQVQQVLDHRRLIVSSVTRRSLQSVRPKGIKGFSLPKPSNNFGCSSPAAPRGGLTSPGEPHIDHRGVNPMVALRTQLPAGVVASSTSRSNGSSPGEHQLRHAKETLRALIRADAMDDAWAWTSKCLQSYPEALCYQDRDKDTLLHIVTCHLDVSLNVLLHVKLLKSR